MKAYRANILFTPTATRLECVERGYVVVDDTGMVEGVYPTLPDGYSVLPVEDFGNVLLIPAMNDLHVHAPQYRNMGLAMDMELLPWLNTYSFPEEAKFADVAYAERMYRRFVHDLWLHGTMRASVYATIHPASTRMLAQLFKEAGMGAYIGLVGMDRNCPDNLRNTTAEVVRDTEELYAYLSGNALVKAIVTPRFLPACTPEMLDALGELAERYALPVQSHLSENRSEVAWVKELEPDSRCYGDAYNKYGLFGQTPTLMAHCCYSPPDEIELMRTNGVYMVQCPTSNCNIGSGVAPVRTFLRAGVPVALGSDISAGHEVSMFGVMRYAMQMSKLQYALSEGKMSFLSLSEAFYLATKGGGAFFGNVGSFERGYAFDALVIDDSALNIDNYSLPHRLERFIYLGDDRYITHRFCQGHCLSEPIR